MFLQLQQRLHLLLHLVLHPGDPALTSMVPGCPWHRRATSCTPARKCGESGTKTGGGMQMQQSRCHIGKGMRLNQPESTCLKSWAGLGKIKLLLRAEWSPWWGLALPHSSSLTALWLPLMSNFAIAMWRPAGILPWQGMGRWQLSTGCHYCLHWGSPQTTVGRGAESCWG